MHAGLAVGIESVVVPVLLSEIATDATRGKITTIHQLMITIGIHTAHYIVHIHTAHHIVYIYTCMIASLYTYMIDI
jgi:hypothetical protein